MKQSRLHIPNRLNADGSAGEQPVGTTTTGTTVGTTATGQPWYSYIGSWLSGAGNIIASTKEPGDVYYYNVDNTRSQNSMLWILAAIAAVVVFVLFLKK